MTAHAVIAIAVFVVAYILIITERIHRTKIAIMGGVLLVLLRVIPQSSAFASIDFNTIGLLVGMMLLIGVLKETGIFTWVAIRIAKTARGNSWRILLWISLFTAVASALLDNVTTVLLIAPITILIAEMLDISPFPFLVAEILSANIGGTATLIGDPPNILIGSATDLSFLDFLVHLGPPAALILVVTLVALRILFRRELSGSFADTDRVLAGMDETKVITDPRLLRRSLVVLSLTMLGFVLHDALALKPATVALAGGGALLIWSGTDIEKRLEEIEWPTLFFFMGLFVLVGGLEETGILETLAAAVVRASDSVAVLSLVVLWFAAIASSFLDNIPFVAAMIPLLARIGATLFPNIEGLDEATYGIYLMKHTLPLWWSLALGACLGGNGTIIGASANVVIAGFSGKTRTPLTFRNYFRLGFPLMLVSILVSSGYIVLRYFVFK